MSVTWKRSYTPPLVIVVLVAGAAALWKWSPDVPKWAQTNTGPWVVAAAVIAFTGVWLTIRFQGHQAESDRLDRRRELDEAHDRALEVARDEREHHESRAQLEWFREKRFEAYVRALNALSDFVNHAVDEPLDYTRAYAFTSAAEVAASVTPQNEANLIARCATSCWDLWAERNLADFQKKTFEFRELVTRQISRLGEVV